VKHLEYDAFGKLINKSGAISVPFFRYTGKFTDDTTELQWNINRWYDANVGRWISEDPIGFVLKEMNLYRYARNNVLISLDSSGFGEYKIGAVDTPNEHPLDLSEHGSLKITTWEERRMLEGFLFRTNITIAGGRVLYPFAAENLNHFLNGKGAKHIVAFGMMNETPEGKTHLAKEINDAIAASEKLKGFNIVTIHESGAEITKGDWLYAIGKYRTWAKGKISILGNCKYKLELTFHLRDNYDWELNDYDSPFPNQGGAVYDYEMALLDRFAYRGVSEYEIVGNQKLMITWTHGERIGSGAIILDVSYSPTEWEIKFP
jgi:RHS repeat-associated protein